MGIVGWLSDRSSCGLLVVFLALHLFALITRMLTHLLDSVPRLLPPSLGISCSFRFFAQLNAHAERAHWRDRASGSHRPPCHLPRTAAHSLALAPATTSCRQLRTPLHPAGGRSEGGNERARSEWTP
eukprot:scaffold181388_cov28-Tisochrysis_lutea.AAC.5